MKRVNEVSALAGVSKRTLQYYDDQGLLPVSRTENNYRLFDDESMERVWQILVYRKMNLGLRDIKEVLAMDVKQRNQFLEEREKKLESIIQEMKDDLDFAKAVQLFGMPKFKNEEQTYVEQIEDIKEEMIRIYRTEYE